MSEPADEPVVEDTATLAQQELLESCLELVFETFDAAVADKVVEPVVFLLDCEDEIGNQIANAWLGAEAVQDAIAEQQRSSDPDGETTTVYARAFAFEDSRREVPQVFPYLASVFDERTPTDGFLAIAVTAGGAAVFTVPDNARESQG